MVGNKGWFNLESGSSLAPASLRPAFLEEESAFKFLGLSWQTRLYGFGACLVLGFVLSLVGSILLFIGAVWTFAVLYILGTIISLIGTGFLIGFFKQLRLMFKPVRVVASIVFIASIVLVFVAAFVISSDVLCIIFVVVEYLAYTWYTLSYIPYARAAVSKAVGLG